MPCGKLLKWGHFHIRNKVKYMVNILLICDVKAELVSQEICILLHNYVAICITLVLPLNLYQGKNAIGFLCGTTFILSSIRNRFNFGFTFYITELYFN